MNATGALDEKAFADFVEWQIAEGTQCLVPVGTTGESPTLSHAEHKRVVEICVAVAKKRVPVMAGAGSNSTAEAIEHGLGRVEQEVLEAIEQDAPGFAGGWVSTVMLGKLMERLRGPALSPQRRVEVLVNLGYVKHPGLDGGRTDNVVLPDGAKTRLYVKPGSPAAALTGRADVARAYSMAQGVTASR